MEHNILPPRQNIDWNNLSLLGLEVEGHVESRWNAKTNDWSASELVKDPYVRVHGLSPGLNYGQQCYEGLKAFRVNDTSISIFRPWKHAKRMTRSAACISLPEIPAEHFVRCVKLAVAANSAYVPPQSSGAMLYIRPVAFGSAEMIGLAPCAEYTFCVYVKPFTAYHGTRPHDALVLEDFDRAAPRGTGSAKVGGNYAPVMRWDAAARKEGFGLTLHLDSATRSEVDEFSTSGFMGVKMGDEGKVTIVVPDSENVIDSVTSDSCQELARSFGWTVEKRPIKYDEIPSFSEVMAVGTAACLVPVSSITRKSTNDKFVFTSAKNGPGPCCRALATKLDAVMRGKEPDDFQWCSVLSGRSPSMLKTDEKVAQSSFPYSGSDDATRSSRLASIYPWAWGLRARFACS